MEQQPIQKPPHPELLIRRLENGYFVSWYDAKRDEDHQFGLSTFTEVLEEVKRFKEITK